MAKPSAKKSGGLPWWLLALLLLTSVNGAFMMFWAVLRAAAPAPTPAETAEPPHAEASATAAPTAAPTVEPTAAPTPAPTAIPTPDWGEPGALPAVPAPPLAFDAWVEGRYAAMGLPHRTGQMLLVSLDAPLDELAACNLVRWVKPAGFVLQGAAAADPAAARQLAEMLQGCARSAEFPPLLIARALPVEGAAPFAGRPAFPAPSVGAPPAAVYQAGLVAGAELAFAGANLAFGPAAVGLPAGLLEQSVLGLRLAGLQTAVTISETTSPELLEAAGAADGRAALLEGAAAAEWIGRLRSQAGFAGLLIVAAGDAQTAIAAANAGVDLLIVPAQSAETIFQALRKAARADPALRQKVETASRRTLAFKAAAAITLYDLPAAAEPDWEAHAALIEKLAGLP
jgi:hypothetical protein